MKKSFIIFIISFLLVFISCGKKRYKEGPEHLYNLAIESMVKKNYDISIKLFYKLYEDYKKFKYRPEVMFRLGFLLYKVERFDESEKVLIDFIKSYPEYKYIRKAYEILIYIYMQEFNDIEKARKFINMYIKKFGEDTTIQNIYKTMSLLSSGIMVKDILSLDAKDIVIISIKEVRKFEKEFYPVLNYIKKERKSYDNKYLVIRKKKHKKYYLYLKNLKTGKMKKIKGSKNGYAPQWSWDSRYILFTSMDWKREERKIKIYDVKRNKTYILFKGKNISPVLCFSPDSSKIVFVYMNELWIMNKNGTNITLLSNKIKVKNVLFIAWHRDGNNILLKEKNKNKFLILKFGKREIDITK